MSGRPQVSVAMAAYNGEAFIEAQIASILPQLEEGDELVISLDPSKDRTAEIIEGFADSRIRLLPGPGEGVQKNFENALRHCGGEILFLCDQDDVWAPDKVESVLSVFAARDALLVLHDAQITDGALHVTEPSFFAAHGTRTGFWRNVLRNSYIGCCMAFRRELLRNALPFPDRLPMHDQWLGLQAERSGRVELLDRPLLFYRRHGGNVSGETHASPAQMLRWRGRLLLALMRRRGA